VRPSGAVLAAILVVTGDLSRGRVGEHRARIHACVAVLEGGRPVAKARIQATSRRTARAFMLASMDPPR
jgi:hypothetical protein